MKELKCQKCKSNIFTVKIIDECDDCEYNGWKEDSSDDYQYGLPPSGVMRDEAYEEGECKLGICYNFGCIMIICTSCGEIFHNPQIETY